MTIVAVAVGGLALLGVIYFDPAIQSKVRQFRQRAFSDRDLYEVRTDPMKQDATHSKHASKSRRQASPSSAI